MSKARRLIAFATGALLVYAASVYFTAVSTSAAHPEAKSTPKHTSNSARRVGVSGTPLHVAFLFPPDCTFQPLSSTPTPAGSETATLNQTPSDLAQSVDVEYTPCSQNVPPNALKTPAAAGTISFHIVSVTRYVGSAGTVYVTLDTPSAAAVSQGVSLGLADGSLADGTALYSLSATGPEGAMNLVQWMHNGTIVTLSSAQVPGSRLTALASEVTVR